MKSISYQQSIAIRDYLIRLKDFPSKQIRQLIIDNCDMTDDVFTSILDSIIA